MLFKNKKNYTLGCKTTAFINIQIMVFYTIIHFLAQTIELKHDTLKYHL